ncbi:MAG: MFS transporter, partial [Actinomycetota bacterium]|nr:MFS transporter [Actinomycetota bacterium]
MTFVRGLVALLSDQRFRQLFAVRVTGQAADGVFQVALASYLLFSPELQPDAGAIAAALAAVLLPFSLLGPFAGVFLDRWSRRQVLMIANLLRVAPVLTAAALISQNSSRAALFVTVLLAFSINRFLLAGLSAALPHVVETRALVLANSIMPTSGTIAFMLGLAVGSGLRLAQSALSPTGVNADVVLLLLAAAGFVLAAALTSRIPRHLLG